MHLPRLHPGLGVRPLEQPNPLPELLQRGLPLVRALQQVDVHQRHAAVSDLDVRPTEAAVLGLQLGRHPCRGVPSQKERERERERERGLEFCPLPLAIRNAAIFELRPSCKTVNFSQYRGILQGGEILRKWKIPITDITGLSLKIY